MAKSRAKDNGTSTQCSKQQELPLQYLMMEEPQSVSWNPKPYMLRGVKFLLNKAYAGLFLDPGMAKTAIVLAMLSILKKKGWFKKTLIIAPRRACRLVWPVEVRKWKQFNHFTYEILHGSKKDAAILRQVDLYLINPEGLEWLLTNYDVRKLGFKFLIIDEIHKFKHTGSRRFKLIKPIISSFTRRIGLTGTPAGNGLINLFGQVYVIDAGATFGPYVTHFRNEYFLQVGEKRFGQYVPQPHAEKEIAKKLAPIVMRMAAEEYLDLPQRVVRFLELDLPDNAREIYRDMEREMITMIDGKVIRAKSAADLSMKCRQIANGGLFTPDHKMIDIHYDKAELAYELAEELQGETLLVLFEFKHDLKRLLKIFGKTTPFIDGSTSDKQGEKLVNGWNARKIDVLLAQPESIGHALNLQDGGNHMFWHSNIWNFETHEQTVRRLLRQGNTAAKVFVYHAIMRRTVDVVVKAAIERKRTTQENLFADLKAYARSTRK